MILYLCVILSHISIVFITSIKTNSLYKEALVSKQITEETTKQNISLLLSQLRPHFLYNALNIIVYLCKTDPKKAEETTITFANYLRFNMSSLNKKDPIPFENELNHIKEYLKIEKLRFDNLNITYDIQCTNFLVPPLSIQPLVENAIKYGITQKSDAGNLTIKTYDDKKNYYINIIDDGIGFDINKVNDKYNETSILNIQKKIDLLCKGFLKIKSDNNGTVVTIIIPKRKK